MRSLSLLALPALVVTLLAPSCTGDAFHGDEGAAGQAGADDDQAAAGRGGGDTEVGSGAAPTSGAPGHAGAGGSGCESKADCDQGRLCSEGACVPCAASLDLATLEFGPAEPFELINGTVDQEGLRAARRNRDGKGLIYVRDFFGGVLWLSTDPEQSAGAALSKTDVFETGGLPTSLELPGTLAGHDFFFSRKPRAGMDVRTRLLGATLSDVGTLSDEAELAAPFNTDGVVASYGLALSTGRAVWTRNVDGALRIQLVTSALPADGEATELRLPLPGDCGFASELDYAPWLTPDGHALFFTARRIDEGCTPAPTAATHLYVVELSSAGQPVGKARVIDPLNDRSVRQTDPSLSPDGCELLFSAQPEGAMKLYHAPRIR